MIDAKAINGLAEKISTLDLSENEQAVLNTVLGRAAVADDDDVAGHSAGHDASQLSDAGLRFGAALQVPGASWLFEGCYKYELR